MTLTNDPTINHISNRLIKGDPFDPSSGDMILQEGTLDVGNPVPDGWRVLDGNMHSSQVVRVVLRYEIEDQYPQDEDDG